MNGHVSSANTSTLAVMTRPNLPLRGIGRVEGPWARRFRLVSINGGYLRHRRSMMGTSPSTSERTLPFQQRQHRHHAVVVVVALVAAVAFGWGLGAAALIAVFGCLLMLGAIAWIAFGSGQRSAAGREMTRSVGDD